MYSGDWLAKRDDHALLGERNGSGEVRGGGGACCLAVVAWPKVSQDKASHAGSGCEPSGICPTQVIPRNR